MYSQRWRYFKQATNYFEWTLYFFVLYFMFPVRNTKTERQSGAAAIAICISWFNLIWFLRRVPDIGTYILTLQKVFKTLIKVYGFISGFWASHAMDLHGEGFFVAGNVRVQLTYISILARGPVLQLHFLQLLFVCSKTI